ncbi:MAG TPA: ABC transporter [Firmicutes bacterium]|jgi:multidrug/hemolysin transport system permease protein|nr:ABC transporter [Bacillota bacterium]
MINFTIRNIKVYFRDRLAVFFSLLSVIIIFLLYALFLGGSWMSAVPDQVSNGQSLLDSWLMAGILAVISLTTTTAGFGTMVDDKVKKIYKDFASSPMKRSHIVGGYILASYFIGVIMSLLALVFLDFYLLLRNGFILGLIPTIEAVGLILLSTLANSTMVFFIASFIKSQTAFATFSTILGTLIGFLSGIYMPVGMFPPAIQFVIKLIPVSHSAALFRRIIMSEPMAIAFNGAPSEVITSFEIDMGISFSIGNFTFSPLIQLGILFGTAILFFGLSLLVVSRKTH